MKSKLFFIFFYFFVLTNSFPTSPPSNHGNSIQNEKDAEEFLKKFGYMKKDEPENGIFGEIKDLSKPIKKLQKFAGLPQTGKLDEKTLKLMNTPRCQLPDPVDEEEDSLDTSNQNKEINENKKRAKRFLKKGKWNKNSLSYFIDNYPTYSNLSKNQVRSEIEISLKDWSSVADINFKKSFSSGFSDVNIGFYSGYHGDNPPFDGPGKTLAHAFYPPSGNLHFDDAEKWSKGNSGVDLRQVSTHEVGHILGLGHSTVKDASMYPYITYKSDFKLHEDDIRGIQYIYGPKIKTTEKKLETTPKIPIRTTTFDINSLTPFQRFLYYWFNLRNWRF